MNNQDHEELSSQGEPGDEDQSSLSPPAELHPEGEEGPLAPMGMAEPLQAQENPFKPAYQRMLSEIKTWGWSSSLLGVIHFVISGILNPSWGISLFVVGGISFLIKEASIFIVYAVIMAWVGVSNVMSGGFGAWTIFGVLQAYWSYQLYRKYQVYNVIEKKYLDFEIDQEQPANRAEDSFPGCGCAMGAVGLLGGVAVFFALVVAATAQEPDLPLPENFQVFEFILGGMLASGILGFALSVAALVAGYKRKWLAWGGVITGGLLMAFEIYLRFNVT